MTAWGKRVWPGKPPRTIAYDTEARASDATRKQRTDWLFDPGVERRVRSAIQEGWRCGFCGYVPQPKFRTGLNPTQKQIEGTKRMLLRRHIANHLNNEVERKWQHPPGFNFRGRIKPMGSKP